MELQTLSDTLTKAELFELYKPISQKFIRKAINYSIKQTGGNTRVKIIPLRAKLDFFMQFGVPDVYKLSDETKKKLIILKQLRTEKC